MALLVSVFCLSAAARGKQPIPFQNLPEMVKSAVLKNFADSAVQYVTWEKAVGKDKYDFLMQNETKIEYFENGILHEIECKTGIPDALVPEPILKYVRSTFPNAIITEYKNNPWNHEVELNNDMELVFSRGGSFLRIN